MEVPSNNLHHSIFGDDGFVETKNSCRLFCLVLSHLATEYSV